MSLLPQNVLQAAEADLKRGIRSKSRWQRASCKPYTFHREHVRRAKTIKQLLVTALMQPQAGLSSKKRNTKLLYGDGVLLVRALRLLQRDYDDGASAQSFRNIRIEERV